MILESPSARRTDPASSHVAAAEHTLSGRRAQRCAMVLRLLRAAARPVTYRELWALHAEECAIDGRNPVEAVEFERRLHDLREEGLAASGDQRRCSISNRLAQEWTPVTERCCRECARPLPAKSSQRRIYCNDFCRTRKYLADRPNAIEPRAPQFQAAYVEGRMARDDGFSRIATPYSASDRRSWWWMRGWRDRQAEQLLEAQGGRTPEGRAMPKRLPTTPGLYLFTFLGGTGHRLTVDVYERDGELYAVDVVAKASALARHESIGPGMRLSRIGHGRITWEPIADGGVA